MDRRRRAQPGRFGTHPVHVILGPVGGSDNIGGASPLTANNTTRISIPTPPGKFVFSRASMHATTAAADADGAVTAVVSKYDASADAEVTVSGSFNVEGLTTKERAEVGPSTSATDAQLLLDEGDTLSVIFTSDSAAIDTQPAALFVVVELMQVN